MAQLNVLVSLNIGAQWDAKNSIAQNGYRLTIIMFGVLNEGCLCTGPTFNDFHLSKIKNFTI